MINRLEVEGFGCIRKVGLDLTPLHALIGPNDAGKSTLLRAIHSLVTADQSFSAQSTLGRVRAFATGPDGDVTGLARVGQDRWEVLHEGRLWIPIVKVAAEGWGLGAIRPMAMIRFDADALKSPSGLLGIDEVRRFPARRGDEVAGVYDAILNRGDESFGRITQEVRKLFPTVANIRLIATNRQQKQLGLRLVDGTEISADEMSEGLLYYLAFLALREVSGARILLIEEPENGLHPARIREVVEVLRKLSETGTQVILTTHSPLVINELEAEEVTIVTRTAAEGTRLTPMVATAHFADRSRVYQLGELWLSYADGTAEDALLGPA